jgi:hypothetical protein
VFTGNWVIIARVWHQQLLTRISTFAAGLLSKQHRYIPFPPSGKNNVFPLQRPSVNAAFGNKSCLFLEPYEAGQWVSGSFPRG